MTSIFITRPDQDSKSTSDNVFSGDHGPGTTIKDLLPIPSDTQPVSNPTKTEISNTLADDPTLSHALATENHDEKGLAQQDHRGEVLDLGWNQKKQEIVEPLVGGLDNEELWLLIRRFNKVWNPENSCLHLHVIYTTKKYYGLTVE